MNNPISLNKLEATLKILSDRTRLIILFKLKNSELCVCDIVETLRISQPAVSQHLRKMKDLEIITEEKRGQWSYYKINKNNVLYDLIQDIIDKVELD
ncbi:helix-turn-helix transcriptional regulator [Clostridium sp. DJ247]|uniref:ArsR/SmtB family transcription factor n=1 Tax=Clostridium sp. DJ247 TaxID=2726188 RepID=UPI0016267FEF|nr:metalloregulator ArsR/SmtB family transcription factor [Clostridium sp. DJ247]MBC2579034.1 winged helix-turn-helix transcriptional regulator [Clostridium sp. DJ247]